MVWYGNFDPREGFGDRSWMIGELRVGDGRDVASFVGGPRPLAGGLSVVMRGGGSRGRVDLMSSVADTGFKPVPQRDGCAIVDEVFGKRDVA